MEVFLKRTISGLVPLYDSDYENLKKIKIGDEVKAEIKKPRNYLFHKKFFALLNLAFQNQDEFDNFEKFRFVMVMKAGWFEAIKTGKGVVYMPKSISFGKMDEFEFEKLYNAMLQEVITLIGADKETIENELISFM